MTQGEFLKRLGIETRALSLMAKATPQVSEDIAGALQRLTGEGRGAMGAMFKVIGISDPKIATLVALSDEPERSAQTAAEAKNA